MTYRPRFQKQADGSRCGWTNCNCASHAMAVDRDWLGAKPSTPVRIRKHLGVFCPTTTMGQNRDAVAALYGTEMHPRFDVPWSTFVDGLVAGRGAVVTLMYKVVHGTPFDGCRTFDGRHAVYVNERRYNEQLERYEALVFDPLADHRFKWIPRGPQWWPMGLLKRGMLASYQGDAPDSVECSFTRNTSSRHKKALYGADTVTGFVGRYRRGPDVGEREEGRIQAGDVAVVAQTVEGGRWTINGKPGTTWYQVTEVDGRPAQARFGVPAVFAAQGWFTGPKGGM